MADVDFTDVLPQNIGLRIKNLQKPSMEDMLMEPIIKATTRFPCSAEKTFFKQATQTKARIPVMQGNARYARDCVLLSEAILEMPETAE